MFKAEIEWNSPEEFKDLSKYKYIAIDLETRDPNLKSKGSGAIREDGEIIGIAVAVEGWSGYYAFGHQTGNFFDKKQVMNWIQDVCALPSVKIFHNAMYDVCWLRSYGIKINGHIVDTMVMASLLDENRLFYSLNSLSLIELGEVKAEAALTQVADEAGVDAKGEMWKLPAMAVGAYAEKAAELTLKLFNKFSLQITQQKLKDVFNLETQLFPCLIDMRFLGVRVDIERAHTLKQELVSREKDILNQIKKETGIDVQLMAARSVAKVFDKLGLSYNRTAKSNSPSFTKNFISNHEHPIVRKIAHAREINKAHSTFIDTILKYEHKGRIHADVNPIRGDSGGTITGRFSYSNPNLQQVPARNKELGPQIRGLFLPERNHTWGCFDYSQQEPRLVVHFAATTQALRDTKPVVKMVKDFNENNADFHQLVADMANIPRTQAKTINLGLFYGMGKAKLQAELGLDTKDEAEELFDKYHSNVPFVKSLMNATTRDALSLGYIKTIGGRRCRFNKWELDEYTPGVLKPSYTEAEAKEQSIHAQLEKELKRQKYKLELGEITKEEIKKKIIPKIKRAYAYKALNKLIQGSAADMTKTAMLNLYNEGIVPRIQLHDELEISVKNKEHSDKIIKIMENIQFPGNTKLVIPNKVDYECGDNWGEIHD